MYKSKILNFPILSNDGSLNMNNYHLYKTGRKENQKIINIRTKVYKYNSIKISFLSGALYFKDMLILALAKIFKKNDHFEIIIINNLEEADIIISSVFADNEYLSKYNCYKICISGEPWNIPNKIHYDLIIDTKRNTELLPIGCQFIYWPLYVNSLYERRNNTKDDLLMPNQNTCKTKIGKTKFCAFLYNACHPHRELFFDKLNSYKKVDPLGKCRSNINEENVCQNLDTDRWVYTNTETYNDLAVSKYLPYKFVIAMENTDVEGYITEKILNPIFAGSIPIYWGTSEITKHFNPKRFIYINHFINMDECIKHIIEVDSNDNLYQQYINEPFFVGNKFNEYLDNNETLLQQLLLKNFV